jgi:hypothetical protein
VTGLLSLTVPNRQTLLESLKEDGIEESANYDEICASVTTFEDENPAVDHRSVAGPAWFQALMDQDLP